MLSLLIGSIASMLMDKGLDVAANAVEGGLDAGVKYLEDKAGFKLSPDKGLTKSQVDKLKDIENDPATRIELEKLALANKKEDNRHGEALIDSNNKNTANARNMNNVAQTSATSSKLAKNFVYIFASVWTLFAMFYIGFITFATIPEANVRFADTILGFVLGTVIASFINYFVGTSQSSSDKNEAIHTALSKGK